VYLHSARVGPSMKSASIIAHFLVTICMIHHIHPIENREGHVAISFNGGKDCM
jgi:hypothetical protein